MLKVLWVVCRIKVAVNWTVISSLKASDKAFSWPANETKQRNEIYKHIGCVRFYCKQNKQIQKPNGWFNGCVYEWLKLNVYMSKCERVCICALYFFFSLLNILALFGCWNYHRFLMTFSTVFSFITIFYYCCDQIALKYIQTTEYIFCFTRWTFIC